jgi:hypothetical protein
VRQSAHALTQQQALPLMVARRVLRVAPQHNRFAGSAWLKMLAVQLTRSSLSALHQNHESHVTQREREAEDHSASTTSGF